MFIHYLNIQSCKGNILKSFKNWLHNRLKNKNKNRLGTSSGKFFTSFQGICLLKGKLCKVQREQAFPLHLQFIGQWQNCKLL